MTKIYGVILRKTEKEKPLRYGDCVDVGGREVWRGQRTNPKAS